MNDDWEYKIYERLTAIDVKQAEMNKDLKEHMRRTAANEKALTILREHTDSSLDRIQQGLEPLSKHLNGLKYLAWAVTGLGTLAGAITKIMNIW